MINKIIIAIDKIIMKRDIILFNSFPDVSDNSLELYRYIINERPDIIHKYRLVWSVSDDLSEMKNRLFNLISGYNHLVVKKKSVKGLLFFFRSKYLITTHGYFKGLNKVKSQMHINLWHGMPLKTIGKGLNNKSTEQYGIDADVTLATSPLFKKIIAYSFGVSKNRVIITGLPRNDLLLEKGKGLSGLGIYKKYDKVIIWMPTYRKSIIGEIRKDGNINGFGIKDVLFECFDRLNNILVERNYLLIVKPHPMDELSKTSLPSSNNIVTINDETINKCNLQLYNILADSDLLITDYSSVFVDYLVTGKPIAFVCDDIEQYKSNRGFFFNPITDYMPGEILKTKDSLFEYLNNIDYYSEKWQEKYYNVRNSLNPLTDSNSSKRICDKIWK